MEYLNFSSLTEEDFTEIVLNVGGRRYTDDPKIKELNCDYILDDAVIELKIIEEEPIEKKTKQEKLAKLFPSQAKTVVLNPKEDIQHEYYQILVTSIQNSLKQASKQLQESAKNSNAKVKIAIIMNNGLTMTSPDEFYKLAIERTKNNTSGIDILIVCGIYYFSDKFDMRAFFEFKDVLIKGEERKEIIEKLRSSWNHKIEQYMINQILDINIKRIKEPIQDLFFELNGIRYVKPPIQWGKPSEFYGKKGRPREDSSKSNNYPKPAIIFPIFDITSYNYVKSNIIEKEILLNSFDEYTKWAKTEQMSFSNSLQFMVHVLIKQEDLESFKVPFSINQLQKCANLKFENQLKNILDNCIEYSDEVTSQNFILVEVHEIGMDKANDIAYISHINTKNNSTQDEQHKWLIYGERMKYEYATLLASTYCLALEAETVYYYRNEDYKWK
ncbi:MAG: hypothetical protein PHF17_11630 [Arcobacteraceae bacterium]|nr:hypothetical protein [Arcobacteraceae bacterium]